MDYSVNDLSLALQHYHAGQFDQAEGLCRLVVHREPQQAEALHLLGLILFQKGDAAAALPYLQQAVAAAPTRADLLVNLGTILRELDQLDEALLCYGRAIALRIDYAEAYNNRGNILQDLGKLDEAVEAYQQAIALQPGNAEFHNNLGSALAEQEKFEAAAQAYGKAAGLMPDEGEFHRNYAATLARAGQGDQAIAACRTAIALDAGDALAHVQLGNLLEDQGDLEGAAEAYRQTLQLDPAVDGLLERTASVLVKLQRFDDLISLCARAQANGKRLVGVVGSAVAANGLIAKAIDGFGVAARRDPKSAQALHLLGNALRHARRLDEARDALKAAVALYPDYADAWGSLGSVLVAMRDIDDAIVAMTRAISLGPDVAEYHNQMARALAEAGRCEDAIHGFDQAIRLDPKQAWIASNRIFTLHYHPELDAASLLRECRVWNDRFAKPLARFHSKHDNDRAPGRRLRIGYVSADFCDHPVGRFILPLFINRNRKAVEVFVYSDVALADGVTDQVRQHVDNWQNVADRSNEQLAEIIRRDGIDILVDLAMHASGNRLLLFALKPAPIQATYLAYASTTGLDAMDYRLSDPFLDPPGTGDADYSEKSIRIESYWCYVPHSRAPQVNVLPAREGSGVTFGCLNKFAKVSAPCLELWGRLLWQVPRSRLILHCGAGSHRQRVLETFARHGVEAHRVEFLNHLALDQYFAAYGRIDIALDPFPYGGGTTTCDALWMGVPVVTLRGRTGVGRAGVSLLNNAGLEQWVAATPQQYIDIAVRWASDLAELAQLRSALRPRLSQSILMNGPRFAGQVEAAFRKMWLQHVAGGGSVETTVGQSAVTAVHGDASIAALRQAVALNPDRSEAFKHLGDALLRKRASGEALTVFGQALRLQPDDPQALIGLGLAWANKDNFGAAAAAFQKAVALRPDLAEAQYNLGLVLSRQGRFDEAMAAYRRAIALKSDYADAHQALSSAMKDAASALRPS